MIARLPLVGLRDPVYLLQTTCFVLLVQAWLVTWLLVEGWWQILLQAKADFGLFVMTPRLRLQVMRPMHLEIPE
jgi:hypothetical protein